MTLRRVFFVAAFVAALGGGWLVVPAAFTPPATGSPGVRPVQRPLVVLLIVIDALRPDHVSLFGYSRPTTPDLERRRKQVRAFADATSSASQTVSSMASLFTGQPARDLRLLFDWRGAWWPPNAKPFLYSRLPLLSERFRDAGYRTAAVVANPWLRRDTGFATGFDTFMDWKEVDGDRVADGARIIDRALGEIGARDARPLFLYAHLMDVHNPYEKGHQRFVRTKGTERFKNGPMSVPPGDLEYMEDLYDSNILYADGLIDRLLREMERRYPRRFVACIMGDHGEQFLEHGSMGHGTSLYQEELRVPVVFYGPGVVTRTGLSHYPLHTTEIGPLLLSFAGGESPLAGLLVARQPEPAATPRVRVGELYAVRTIELGNWKYTVRTDPFSEELYDLNRDPGEKRNLASQPSEVLMDLRSRAQSTWMDLKLVRPPVTRPRTNGGT